jgi:uncharacterized protein YkwD|tara:strand:+ start:2814 stop:3323 length:510 start_codon:yes stop_codon:yes gene_type:complete
MKRLITTLLLSVLVFISYSQTPLDHRIFKTLNEYRVSKDLEPWIWTQELFPMPLHHSNYMMLLNDIEHEQGTDIPNFTEHYSLDDRFNNSDVDWVTGGENVAVVNCKGLSDNVDMSKKVLKMWINSPPHHELLLSTIYKYGAVSAIYSKTWVGSKNSDFWNYITLNVYK